MKFHLRTRLALPALAVALLATSSAQAQIYSQNFESLAVGNLTGQGAFTADAAVKVNGGGGVGYTGGNNTYVLGGNNSVTLNATTGASNGNYAGTTFTAQSGGNLFFSFTYIYNNANKATDTGADFFRLQFSNTTNATTNDYLGVQVQGGTATQSSLFLARGRSSTNNPGVNTATGVVFSDNGTQSYFVTGRLNWNGTTYSSIDMWINPTVFTVPNNASQYLGTQSSSMTGSTLTSISALVFQNGTTNDNLDVNDWMKIDNLRLGTTFDSIAAVPESGTVAAGMAFLLVVAGVIRRRQRLRC